MVSADGYSLSNDDAAARIQQALRSVALGVSAVSGCDVFAAIARHAAESLGADFSLVSRLSDDDAGTLTTLAIYHRGQILPNVDYVLANTPCERVFDKQFYLLEHNAQAVYPGEETLEMFDLHSYAGYPLFGSDGSPLGLIAVADKAPMVERELTETLLQIFSVRAAAELERLAAVTRDISARKQAEEERAQLELQLRQAQRMEAIGHLSGGIAHDFNNILTGLLGYAVMAQERAEQFNDEPLQRYLSHALRSAEKARDLIQQMLTFSRGSRGEPRLIAPAEILSNFFPLLDSTLPATIEIEHQFARDLPPVLIDPVQLEQVLMNLSINARDAMNSQGELRLTLQRQSFKGAVCSSCMSRVSGDYVVLSVSDNGPGIAPGVHARMFEPFFTTKSSGKSSGMGLAMVHGIVHECGGHVLVESQPGVGTTFRVLMPPSDDSDRATPTPPLVASHRREPLRGRVAIVDDEREVASFMSERLHGWGLDVEYFCDSVVAAEAISADIETWDLVILDQTMPRLTGIELARQLTLLRGTLPLLLYSGYADELSETQLRLAGVQALMKKPVDQEQLYRLLATLLQPSQLQTDNKAR